jgi:amino acid adenylation domain-containing protein
MKGSLPLSTFQLSVWKGQKLRPRAPLYNTIFTFDIHGIVDSTLFIEAFEKLVDTTTVLRLVLDESDPEVPKQVLAKGTGFIEYLDFTQGPNIDLEEWMEVNNQVYFDLTQRSYHTALLKISEEHYIWYFNQHHIFTDAYSNQILFNQLSKIYQAIKNNEVLDLNLLDDHAAYIQNIHAVERNVSNHLSTNATSHHDSYSLYGNKFPSSDETRSIRTHFTLAPEMVDQVYQKLDDLQLKTIASGLDLLSFLLASFLILLSKVGGKEETVQISNILSKRTSKNSKELAGPLLEILHSAIPIKAHDTFVDIYQKVYSFLILRTEPDAAPNQSLPPSIVNYFDLAFGDFAGIPTDIQWRHSGHMDVHHFIRFHILRYNPKDDLTLAFDIKTGHGVDDIGQQLLIDFKHVVHKLLDNATLPMNQFCILRAEEIKSLHEQINQIGQFQIDQNDYLSKIMDDQFTEHPTQTAIRYKDETITYEQLKSRSLSVAQTIRSLNLGRNMKVVVYLPRSPEYLYAILGSLYANACFIPVPHSFPLERLKYIIKDVNADLLIHAERQMDVDIASMHIDAILSSGDIVGHSSLELSEAFYILYTSGSSGKPKGVPISHLSMTNYIHSVKSTYLTSNKAYHMPLFTSVGFDLTMTSIFLPLCTGGSIYIYEEINGADLTIREVVQNQFINCFKCTPSHLKLIENQKTSSTIQSIIVGGENFTRQLALQVHDQFNQNISIFNEYGPTEATIGCIAHQFDPNTYRNQLDVPIGKPLHNHFAFVATDEGIPLPRGVIGELCVGGLGLSGRYINDIELSDQKYSKGNDIIPATFYKTGDIARLNEQGDFEYLGRVDNQIKVGGIRIETGEIEKTILSHAGISRCIVTNHNKPYTNQQDYTYCEKCGLPSNYPTADFDERNICAYCRSFEGFKNKVEQYFKTEEDFKKLFDLPINNAAQYDCIMLYSGGKDSTYALGKLAEMGLNVLAFTLDNGYISDSAKQNIKKVVDALNVDHIYGSTPAMNEIFVDSLKTHCNVCNGCFKTIYNLSLKIAHEKNIPYIITGLSRGQFFETKLSEEIFWKPMADASEIEETLFTARKAYHTVKDTVYEKTDGQFIVEHNILDKVKIVDFYRYHDVTLDGLLHYINTALPWIRPDDTGRSTNCLINKLGIYVHKKQKGYSNYAFPYSWDVRTGHKTVEETIDEIEEYIDEDEVKQMINEIGYQEEDPHKQLVAYYQGEPTAGSQLRSYLLQYLPEYMVPTRFVHVEQFPLTNNGKIDLNKLQLVEQSEDKVNIAPSNEIEEMMLAIWKEVLGNNVQSVDDDFFELGGTSLDAIRITARLEKSIQYELSVNLVFEIPTIQKLSNYILEDMRSIIESNQHISG